MDALEFMKYAKKMCAQYGVENQKHAFCQGCPALTEEDEICIANFQFDSCIPDKAVEAVEKYAKEYPIETNQDRFRKVFPEVKRENGFINMCPRIVSMHYRTYTDELGTCTLFGKYDNDCRKCEKEFWLSEAE